MASPRNKPTNSVRAKNKLPPETQRLNTSAAEPSTSAERPVSSSAEAPKGKLARRRNSGKPQLISSRLAYKGNVFSVYTDTLIEPGDDRARSKDVIRHNGSVVILAMDETNPADPEIILIRQYRHAAGQFLLELPAGRIEPNEAPLAAAKREMIEETGYRAKKWLMLTKYFASPGFLGEWMQIYLARDIRSGPAKPEEDEHIELVRTPLSQAMELIAAGKIHDGKTLIGLSLLHQARESGRLNTPA